MACLGICLLAKSTFNLTESVKVTKCGPFPKKWDTKKLRYKYKGLKTKIIKKMRDQKYIYHIFLNLQTLHMTCLCLSEIVHIENE